MTPNQEQLAVITAPEEQTLVIAGAGTGKTKTLVWRIQYLVKGYIEGVAYDFPHDDLLDPAAMVAITFTNIAARQLQERLAALGITLGFVGTLHAYALHCIKRAGKLSQFSGSPTIISEEASADMIQATAKELRVKNVSVSEVKHWLGRPGGRPAQLVATSYMRKLAATNSLCYDSMLAEFLRLLVTSPLPAPIEALFVDEYQDSAPMDAAIYSAINAEFDMRIGDPDQAIYSFRGGEIGNLIDYGRTEGVGVYHLTTNYRSCSRIVAKANALIAGAPDNPFREFMQANNGSWDRDGDPPDGFYVTSYQHPAAEAQGIAEKIAYYKCQKPSDFAILCRFNAYVPLLKQTLAANGIPVKETRRFDPPRRIIAALRALSLVGAYDDAVCADWLYTVAQPGEETAARRDGRSLTSVVMQRLGVTKTESVGEALHKMGIDAEGVRLVRDNWQSDPDQTADVLAIPDEQTLAEGVHVGTVHSFKGGEAGFVFLAGWDSATCPAQKKGPEFNEERRLAYVGVTRGIFRVEMSYCITSIDSAGRPTRDNTACPFLLP